MRFLLSNIADIHFAEVDGRYIYQSNFSTLSLCHEHQLGMELADLSMVGSLSQNRESCIEALRTNVSQLNGLPITLHAPFSELYPHAMEQSIRQIAYDSFLQSYALAEEFHALTMVVHANHISSIYHPDWFVDHQVSFWSDFLQHHPGHCAIAIENTIDETPDLLLRIAQGVGDPRFGICLDMGHAHLSPISVESWLRTLAPYLRCYHIHNNGGIRQSELWYQSDAHNALDNGTLDFAHLLLLASQLTPDATVTIETTALAQSLAWLKSNHFLS